MAEDKSHESSARSEAAAERQFVHERGQITRMTMASESSLQHSRLDTGLNTTTTPQSAIDNWRPPAAPAPVPPQGSTSDGSATSEPTSASEK